AGLVAIRSVISSAMPVPMQPSFRTRLTNPRELYEIIQISTIQSQPYHSLHRRMRPRACLCWHCSDECVTVSADGVREDAAAEQTMTGTISFDQLKKLVAAGDIDTVLASAVDMQGRLIGKRFLARFFVESAYDETHGCNYLLANDIDMEPVPGYK